MQVIMMICMKHRLGNRFEVIGEHGYGKIILVLTVSPCNPQRLPFSDIRNGGTIKCKYIYLDLALDESLQLDKLITTLKHYHYIKNFFIEFPVLRLFIQAHARFNFERPLEGLWVYNPLPYPRNLLHKIFVRAKGVKYIDVQGTTCRIPHSFIQTYEHMDYQLGMLPSKRTWFIGLQNPGYAFKLAAKKSHSKFIYCKSYMETAKILLDETI